MRKLTTGLISLSLLITTAVPVLATQEVEIEKCGATFNYTKSSDYNDSRININYQDGDEAVTVTTGYKIVKVEADVDDDGQANYVDYSSQVQNGVKWNPNPGNDINSLKVTIEKVCTSVCPDETASNYEAPVEGTSVGDLQLCSYPEPEPEPEPEATPSATPKGETPVLPQTGNSDWLVLFGYGIGIVVIGFGLKYLLRKK